MPTSTPAWVQRFPALQAVTDSEGLAVLAATREIELPGDATVFRVGDPCHNYLLVLEGSVRVHQTAPNGREIVLYRVQQGESCILTTSCLMGHTTYVAEGVTETPVRAVAFAATDFQRALERSPGFRRFVFEGYGQRIADLMAVIEELIVGKVDVRLAKRLLSLADERRRVTLTHQALATELGSAREVVSRQLKEFERRGWVEQHRGEVLLTDTPALQRLAQM